jgi:hypothetical protein
MPTYLVNSNTSVIPIKTNTLSTAEYVLVYLPTTSNIGQLITIRDSFGYLSSPQAILVSTTGGASITGGTNPIRIQQGYGYVTLRSESTSKWSIIDQNAFSSPTQNYAMRGITYGAVNVIQTGYIINSVSSTGSYLGINTQIFSTLESIAPIFANSVGVNFFNTLSDTYFQNGSAFITGSTVMLSSLSLPGSVSITGNANITGPMGLQSSMTVTGPFTFSTNTGRFTVQNIVSTNFRFYADNSISTGGTTSISSFARVQDNMYVSSLTTNATYANMTQTNEIVFSANVYIRNRSDITVASATYTDVKTPVIQMQDGIFQSTPINANTFVSDLNTIYYNTGILNITSSIKAPGVTQMYLNNAAINNPAGSLTISSIATNSLTLSNITIFGGNPANRSTIPIVTTGNVNTSSIYLNGGAIFPQRTTVNFVIINTCSTNNTTTSSLIYGDSALIVPALSLSTFFVSSAFIANTMSSFSIPNSLFNNSQGRLYTSNVLTSTVLTSSLYGVSYISANSSITIFSSTISIQSAILSTANTLLPTSASTIFTNGITFGAPYQYSTLFINAPYMTTSTISGLTSNTNYEFITGQGIPYNPLRIKAAVDRTVNIYLQNTSSFAVRYLTMQYTYQNSGSAAGSAGLRMVNNGLISTIFTFSASPIQTIQTASLSNFPVNANPIISTYQYYLTGPTTYAPPSTTISRNIIVAGGISQTTTLAYSSDGGSSWVPLKFTTLTSSCLGVARATDKWLAAGEGISTSLAYSYNGSIWYSAGKNIFTIRGRAVAWNGSLWVGAGEGTNTLAYSKDGVNWTGIGSTIFTAGNSVAWNGTQWLATGVGSNTLAYSADGTSWTGLGSTIFTRGTAVAWGTSNWVAVGGGSNTLAYSANGTSWTGLGSTIFVGSGTAIGWNGTQWLAGGGNQIATSLDGINWSNRNVSTILSSVQGVTYASSNWAITGVPLTNAFAYSSDGANWIGRTVSTIFTQGQAITGRGPGSITATSFLPVIAGGSAPAITTDGTNWVSNTIPLTTVNCIAWNGTRWVAGGTGTYQLAYSTNGTTWVGVTLPNMTAVQGVAWGYRQWIACGTGPSGYTSASSLDGITWTEIVASTGGFFTGQATAITWAENLWVATGATLGSGLIFSLDGVNWTQQSASIFTTGRAVANNGIYWLAGGDYLTATLAYSYDGAVWISLGNSIFSSSVGAVAWGQNIWVAVGTGTNSIAFSYDGINWVGLGLTIFTTGTSVTWNGRTWFATGTGPNTFAYSADGVNWVAAGTTIAGGCLTSQIILPSSAVNVNEPTQIRWDLSGTLLMSPSSIENPVNSLVAWNSRASSLDGYISNAFMTFTIRQTNNAFMMGLSESPRTTNSFTVLNYAFYLTAQTTVFIYEMGTQIASLGAFRIADVFKIAFTGTQIIYYINGTPVRTVTRAVGNPLYLSSSFRTPGCRVDGIQFQPLYQIVETQPTQNSVSYLASIRPSIDTLQSVTYSMPATTSTLRVGQWQFNIPVSANLSSLSSILYIDLAVNSTKLFSTNYIVGGLFQQPSTYGIQFNVSTFVSTASTDIINLNVRTQRGTGESYFYTAYSTATTSLSTVVRNDIYNMSSIAYLQFYHTSFNSGIQTSEITMSLNSLSTPTQKYIDSNYGVTMNRGYMVWPNRLYGLAINNQFNDLQTRSITYTGSLLNASDSNLKRDIDGADIAELYESIDRLPLRYYGFGSAYMSTFQPMDRHQIGVLTTEVGAIFPKMIKEVEPANYTLSTLQTVDRGQLKFAHLGATQFLIQKISSLSGELRELAQTTS